MRTLAFSLLLFATCWLGSVVVQAQPKTSKLTITVVNLLERTGSVRVGLVTKADNFMGKSEIDTAVVVPKEGPIVIVLPNLPTGTYAVQLYHDLNDNKTMDRQGQMPSEPFGFSNIGMLMGPPTFEQAAFEVKEDTDIRIRLLSL